MSHKMMNSYIKREIKKRSAFNTLPFLPSTFQISYYCGGTQRKRVFAPSEVKESSLLDLRLINVLKKVSLYHTHIQTCKYELLRTNSILKILREVNIERSMRTGLLQGGRKMHSLIEGASKKHEISIAPKICINTEGWKIDPNTGKIKEDVAQFFLLLGYSNKSSVLIDIFLR